MAPIAVALARKREGGRMFFGHIANAGDVERTYPAAVAKAIRYLQAQDFNAMKPGRYELDGDKLILQVLDLQTRPFEENWPEIHRKYIDVQLLAAGEEIIRVTTDPGDLIVVDDKLAERDILFYADAPNEAQLYMQPGNFAVFFPQDVHRPNCALAAPCPIRKVVLKVALSSLVGTQGESHA
jgi:YhcH/YjgK/YiaL family protein